MYIIIYIYAMIILTFHRVTVVSQLKFAYNYNIMRSVWHNSLKFGHIWSIISFTTVKVVYKTFCNARYFVPILLFI